MMKMPQTLRSRVIVYFCGYLAVLMAIYAVALSGMFRLSEDLAFNRQLSEISESILQHVETYGEMPVSLPMHVSAYAELSRVPLHLRHYVTNQEPGVFEISSEDVDLHAALVRGPSTGQVLYVFYDVSSIESTEQFESFILLAMGGIGLVVLFVGWILARSVSNRILDPVSELARVVQSISLNDDTDALSAFKSHDEVGALADKIRQFMTRISEFTRREREFTSHASHELRTPVTVIRGATELLRGRSDDGNHAIGRPLARIERAVAEIERLIDTFLLLARQEQKPDNGEVSDLREVVDTVVASYRHLLENKPVSVTVLIEDSGSVQAQSSLVTIALGNIVRNAFKYTMQGRVDVIARSDRVSVRDSGPGIDTSRQSEGLGLVIVERLCERMNCRFVIASTPGEGTRADLIFASNSPVEIHRLGE